MTYCLDEDILYIFTDGASRSGLGKKPRRVGGMGVFFVYLREDGEEIHEDMSDYIGYIGATNNDMELQAAIEGLKIATKRYDLSPYKKVMIITDSQFVCNNRRSAYHNNWTMNKWQTKYKDPVIHKPQWKQLAKLINQIKSTYYK